MTAAFVAGAVFGGNSAGAAVQSVDMINGYTAGNGPAESMRKGAVELCTDDPGSSCVPRPRVRLPEPHHRPARVRVRTHGPLAQHRRRGVASRCSGSDAATGAVVTDYDAPARRDRRHGGLRHRPGHVRRDGVVGRPERHAAHPRRRVPPARPGHGRLRLLGDGAARRRRCEPGPGLRRARLPGLHHGARRRRAVPRRRHRRRPGGRRRARVRRRGRRRRPHGSSSSRPATRRTSDARADAKAIAAALAPSVASATWFTLGGNTRADDVLAALDGATGVVLTASDRSLVGRRARHVGPGGRRGRGRLARGRRDRPRGRRRRRGAGHALRRGGHLRGRRGIRDRGRPRRRASPTASAGCRTSTSSRACCPTSTGRSSSSSARSPRRPRPSASTSGRRSWSRAAPPTVVGRQRGRRHRRERGHVRRRARTARSRRAGCSSTATSTGTPSRRSAPRPDTHDEARIARASGPRRRALSRGSRPPRTRAGRGRAPRAGRRGGRPTSRPGAPSRAPAAGPRRGAPSRSRPASMPARTSSDWSSSATESRSMYSGAQPRDASGPPK